MFKSYQEADFDPFQSIAVPAISRQTQYIVFTPGNEGFKPSVGEMELELFFRTTGKGEWNKARGSWCISIDSDSANIWGEPESKSILLETTENQKFREVLMEKVFR